MNKNKLESFDNTKAKCDHCKKYFDKEHFVYGTLIIKICFNCIKKNLRNCPKGTKETLEKVKQKIKNEQKT